MKSKLIYLSLMAIIIIGNQSCKTNNGQTISSLPIVPVKIQSVKLFNEKEFTNYVGVIEESISIPTSFLTTGQVERVYVSEGERVRKGQILAELNSSSYLSMYQISLAKQKQAEDAYNRLSELYRKGSLPEIKYIEIQAAVEQARSSTQIAMKNLNDCKLYAPMDGIVGKRSIEPGMNILPSVIVFNIVKIDKVYVKVSIPENEISKIVKGCKSEISVAALNYENFEGVVEEKGVIANPLSHTYDVKIAVLNKNEKLYPGMVCNVQIGLPSSSAMILIPHQAVQEDQSGRRFVFVVSMDSNRATQRFVEIGSLNGNGVIIKKGLNPGDMVIVEGYQNLAVSSPVQIVK